ncbi:MAG: UDP-glucose 4-epimerase GalE [Verrucomicrobia bacterium]|nr:UDP-glucose 4-epimerase GalE [Verrucomicrobiota bacterium]
MKILIAGGAGYIGSHCVRLLRLAGHEPVVVDNLVFGHRRAVDAAVPFYEADLGDVGAMTDLLRREQVEAVMHFAAFAYVGESVHRPLKYYLNNVAATLHLLDAMQRAGVRRFVFSSTCATFGVVESLPIIETLPQKPINPYGQTKLDVEIALRALCAAEGFSAAAFRYFNAAGAAEDGSIGEDHDPESHLIPLAIGAAQGKRPALRVFGLDYPTPDGTCLRDYVHVDDLARAHIAALPLLETPGRFVDYNLGTGTPTSVLEVIGAVEAVTGLKVPWEPGERREGDPPALYADSVKARRELGWVPVHTGIRSIVETAWNWHRSHPDGYGRASAPVN